MHSLVKDLMTTQVVTVGPATPFKELVARLAAANERTAVVLKHLGSASATSGEVAASLTEFVHRLVTVPVAVAVQVAVCVGVPLGVWAAVRHNHLADHAARAVSLVGAASPILTGSNGSPCVATPRVGG